MEFFEKYYLNWNYIKSNEILFPQFELIFTLS